MSELRVTSRYAKSLIDLSIEQNNLEGVNTDVSLFMDTLKASSELQAVLRNPIIPLDKKTKILHEIFGQKVSKETIAFFDIMVRKGRGEVLYATAKEFGNQYNEKKGIVKAELLSAAAVTPDAEKEVIAIVEKATGKKVILDKKVEPSLIGGFILRIGDKQFDLSISKSLRALQKEFSTGRVSLAK